MFTKFMEQPSSNSNVIAAAAPAPNTTDVNIKKLEELSNQVKQIQKQQQWYQQLMHAGYAMAAHDQPPGRSRPFQSRN